jgi:hypothetical protein
LSSSSLPSKKYSFLYNAKTITLFNTAATKWHREREGWQGRHNNIHVVNTTYDMRNGERGRELQNSMNKIVAW